MAHSNYAKDRDLMQEAYGSVSGNIPATQSTAMARGYVLTESHCSDEEKLTKVELGGKVFEIGSDDPNDDGIVIEIEKHANGYFITGGVYSEPEDYVNDPENPKEGYGYALTLDGQPMDEDDLAEDGEHAAEDGEHEEETGEETVTVALELDKETAEKLHNDLMPQVEGDVPAEDSSCASHEDAEGPSDEFFKMLDDVSMEVDTEDHHAVVAGMQLKLGRKLTPLEIEHCEQVTQNDELPEDAEGMFPDGEGKYEVADIGGLHGQGTYSGPEYGKSKVFNSLKDACAAAGVDPSECQNADEWIDMEGDGKSLELAVDEDTAIVMHKNVSTEDAEGHHPSGSDDGECDDCGGDGCDVCNGSGEQDEEEVVSESYTAQYLLK